MRENPHHPWVEVGMMVVLLETRPHSKFKPYVGEVFEVIEFEDRDVPWFRPISNPTTQTKGSLLTKIAPLASKSIEELL